MFTKSLTFILYDGISNSIFSSQVLQPLLNLLKENNNLEINLVSFEKTKPSNKIILELIPAKNNFNLILCRRLPFFGKSSLKLAIYQLKKIFQIIKTDQIIARGPLAGFITIKTLNKIFKKNSKKFKVSKDIKLKIQARGLCAEEYRFTSQSKNENIFLKQIRKLIYSQLINIEKEVYKENKKLPFQKTIEAVSPALKEYISAGFGTSKSKIILATKDIPKNIDLEEKQKWRNYIRNKLGIKPNQKVFCYSGSYKPWQCIPEIIEYFFHQYEKNPNCFLMLLSTDIEELKKLLKNKKIPEQNYTLLFVKSEDLYKYMAASDIGLLFRNKDIINWVSRPTKMLEYQSVGLPIIHNQTIAWLEN